MCTPGLVLGNQIILHTHPDAKTVKLLLSPAEAEALTAQFKHPPEWLTRLGLKIALVDQLQERTVLAKAIATATGMVAERP